MKERKRCTMVALTNIMTLIIMRAWPCGSYLCVCLNCLKNDAKVVPSVHALFCSSYWTMMFIHITYHHHSLSFFTCFHKGFRSADTLSLLPLMYIRNPRMLCFSNCMLVKALLEIFNISNKLTFSWLLAHCFLFLPFPNSNHFFRQISPQLVVDIISVNFVKSFICILECTNCDNRK